jgi:shikimate kinase
VHAVTEKLLMYALGRNVQYYDRPAIRQIVRQAAAEDYTFAALIQGIVRSVPFGMRKAPVAAAPESAAAAAASPAVTPAGRSEG